MNQTNQARFLVFSRRSVSKRRKCIYAPTNSGISCAMSCSYTIRILWIFCSSISLCSELDPFPQMVRVGEQKEFCLYICIVNRHISRDTLRLHSHLQVNEVDIHPGLDNPSRSTAELNLDNSAFWRGRGNLQLKKKLQQSMCSGEYLKNNISTLLPRIYPDT